MCNWYYSNTNSSAFRPGPESCDIYKLYVYNIIIPLYLQGPYSRPTGRWRHYYIIYISRSLLLFMGCASYMYRRSFIIIIIITFIFFSLLSQQTLYSVWCMKNQRGKGKKIQKSHDSNNNCVPFAVSSLRAYTHTRVITIYW